MGALEQILRLRDGRTLGFAELGDPGGMPVVLCHGFPGSRLDALLAGESARRCGVRLICADRPGYGLSGFKTGRRIANFGDDLMELADALGLGRFLLLGVSGGGPYALGCACRHPERIRRLALVCALGHLGEGRALAAMRWPGRLSFTLARRSPALAELFFRRVLGPLIGANPALALHLLSVGAPESDRQVLARPEVRSVLKASASEAFRQGARGPAFDLGLYASPWGFDPASLGMPLDIWHGEADAVVPCLHSRLLAEALPGAGLRLLAGEGHFSLPVRHMDDIFRALLAEEAQAEA